ncbi:MAG: hypothetical protein HC840_09455 [Leptolyngbyaceae cyanobacterium RM2_2_4]|nr:hypothetical protein [Leptolyngbyaceae cyanobacterium SM1_4_3]NJO49624.1 hypothetical protein [Leptolyngbyaceae cyanobacterium RM2_2_4]
MMRNLKRQPQSSHIGNYITSFGDVPLAERRGLGHIDAGNIAIAVKEEVQRVSEAIVNRYRAGVWCRDIYGQSIRVQEGGIVVFRFKFHDWTLIQVAGFQPIQFFPNLRYFHAEHLARDLGTEAVFCKTADGLYQYYLYASDKNPEGFYFDSCFDDDSNDESDRQNVLAKLRTLEYLEEPDGDFGHFGFYSSLRENDFRLTLLNLGSPSWIMSDLLGGHGIYIPTVGWEEKEIGENVQMSVCGLGNDDIERMDYISISSATS